MINTKGINKESIMAGLVVAIWVVILCFVAGAFKISTTWPAFLVMITFFLTDLNPKNLINILVGGCAGLLSTPLFYKLLVTLIPSIGQSVAILLLVFLFVFVIIGLKEFFPILFNNYFMLCWTVSLIIPIQQQATFTWIGVMIIGGLGVVGGILGTLHLLTRGHKEADDTLHM